MSLTLPTAAGATTEYEDYYESTLSAPLAASDTDIFVTNLPSSVVGFLVIGALTANPETIFYNVVGANYVRCPSATDGEGRGCGTTTPRAWDQGTPIGMYSIAEYFEGIVKGLFMRDGFLQSRHFGVGIDPNSWIGTGETWNYVGNNGQKEYQYIVAGDKTAKYTNGMKVRMPRVIAAPTMCADFETSSSQYAARTSGSVVGVSFLDDYTVEAKVWLESYGNWTIGGRYTGGGTDDGFALQLSASGQIIMYAAGTGFRQGITNQAVPLGRWVHIAATMDMSGGVSTIYMDGVPLIVGMSGAATQLTQSGDLMIGNFTGGTQFFDGKIADFRIWNTVRTQAQIRDNMHRYPAITTGLVVHHKLDGNFNDASGNGNTLTSFAGVTSTTVDNDLKAVEYGIITDRVFAAGNTTMTIFTGQQHNAPYENLSGISYSAARTPLGFPAARHKWSVELICKINITQSTPTINQWYNIGSLGIYAPTGEWLGAFQGTADSSATAASTGNFAVFMASLSTLNNAESDPLFTAAQYANNVTTLGAQMHKSRPVTTTAQTLLYLIERHNAAATNGMTVSGANGPMIITLESAYV